MLAACATQSPAPIVTSAPAELPGQSAPTAAEPSAPVAAPVEQTPPPIESPASSAPVASPPGLPQPPAQPSMTQAQGRALLLQLLPPRIRDRNGWADDIVNAFTALKLPYTRENFCATASIIEQESSWQSDPTVPGLPDIAWKKIGEKAAEKHIPLLALKAAFLKTSPNGKSYKERIDNLRTEREMSEIFEDLSKDAQRIGLSTGMTNPIHTGGPMQVSVSFAQAHVRAWPYPYPLPEGGVRGAVFTRRGGVYFGTAILLQYPQQYDDMVYRFADYNAGRYSSRNAAFQSALARISGRKVDLDGDLLVYVNGVPDKNPSDVEQALGAISSRLGMNAAAIRRDLLTEKTIGFGQSEVYRKVFALADTAAGRPVPRAVLPQIRLISPKITRNLTTAWFAQRVDGRYKTCLARSSVQ